MMSKRHALALLGAVVLALALPAVPATAAPMTYPCYQPNVAPVIDGQISDDPAWSNMPVATGFSKLGDGFTEAKQTSFQACWDDDALCLGVVCEEPDVARMKLSVRDGGEGWLDDGIEVFIQPVVDRQVCQLIFTAGGARCAGEGAPDFLKCQAAVARGQDFYALEASIPWEVIGATPATGDQWRGDVCRNIFTTFSGGDQFTCWAPLLKRFLEPEHFAVIDFRGPAPSAEQSAAITEQINAGYRAHLVGELRAVAAQADEYLPTLEEARRDPNFGRRARELTNQWRQLERLQQDATGAPITEGTGAEVSLRGMLKGAGDLLKASYELKYAYLISKLFP